MLPLILFSGMAADATVFAPQSTKFADVTIPEWPKPFRNETLQSYCVRLADSVNPDKACFVGGASFGGIVAQEVCQHLNAKGCFLIGSIRNGQRLPLRIRVLRPLVPLIHLIPIKLLQRITRTLPQILKRLGILHFAGLARQFGQSDPDVLRWSMKQVFARSKVPTNVPIRQIHGSRDSVFPVCEADADVVVAGGGHVISMTHGRNVNEFLQQQMLLLSTPDQLH